jgi:hypothetical protein
MSKLTLLVSIALLILTLTIECEQIQDEITESELMSDYKKLNHDLLERIKYLEKENNDDDDSEYRDDDDDDDSSSVEKRLMAKRFPRWGSEPKSLNDLKTGFGKRFPKWRNNDFKSLLKHKYEPYHEMANNPMRKIWEKNMLEKNKIYEKNNLI